MLVLDLNCPVVNDESKEERKKILVDYFSENLNRHNFYAFRFFICEALNFINVFVQIYFMDYFLGGEFSTYGSDVLSFTEMEPEERGDPMSRVFPKVTKCTFHKYGPSGSVQKFDGESHALHDFTKFIHSNEIISLIALFFSGFVADQDFGEFKVAFELATSFILILLSLSFFLHHQCFATQHCEREDFRFLVVLVHRLDNLVRYLASVPYCSVLLAEGSPLLASRT